MKHIGPFWLAAACSLTFISCLSPRNFTDPAEPRFVQCCAEAPEPDSIRVVTFNIRHSREIEGAIQLFRSSEPLRNPDIVLLQEMDAEGVQRIAEALALANHVYYPAIVSQFSGRDFGNAILSRWPIVEDRKILLPHLGQFGRTLRTAVRGTVLVGSRRIRVYSIHFATILEIGPGRRRDQALAVLRDAASSPDPVIIAGDTNGTAVWKSFEDRGYRCATLGLGPTVRAFALDHIFLRGLRVYSEQARGVVAGASEVSDHRPVWAALRLDPAAPEQRLAGIPVEGPALLGLGGP